MVVSWLLLSLAVYTVCGAKCPDYMFPCDDGHCVVKEHWCDTLEDCFDSSDEKYCSRRIDSTTNPNGCDETFFLCKDGVCIPKIGRCDGVSTCPDGSDEEDCGTTTHATNGTTISLQVTTASTKLEEATATRSTTTVGSIAAGAEMVLEHDHRASPTDRPVALNESGNEPSDVGHHSVPEVYATSAGANDSGEASDHYNPVPISQNAIGSEEASKHADHVTHDTTSQNTTDVEVALKHDDHGVLQADSTAARNTSNEDLNRQPHDSAKADHGGDPPLRNDSGNHRGVTNLLPTHKEEDLRQKFLEISSHNYRIQRINAQKWLTKVRDEDYGWGDETARAITALYMSSDDLKLKQSEKLLMSNQLKLRLFSALMRNVTKQISLAELALYINALAVSCEDPCNFYGHDLVDILRQRTNVAQKSTSVVPFVYLTLCLNNATSHADVGKLHKFLHDPQNTDRIGIEAMVYLASTCMYRSLQWPESQQGLATRFLDKIRIQGFPENIYDLALLVQALNEARINQDLWNRSEVMNRVMVSQQFDGSFGDILSTYYVMPLLSGRSLASFNQHCQHGQDKSLVPVEILKNGKREKFVINYILRYGDPMEMSQTLQMPVKKSTSVFDIMRISETLSPSYRFRYVMSHGKPCVYSIGGVINDAEKGLYWSLYIGSHRQNDTTVEDLALFEGDIRSFIPSWGQYVVFWLKPVF